MNRNGPSSARKRYLDDAFDRAQQHPGTYSCKAGIQASLNCPLIDGIQKAQQEALEETGTLGGNKFGDFNNAEQWDSDRLG